ncbi:hypothetical protein [Senegalia massiliensis]|uniref:Sigma factor n=1 Tax=Senegalia massiliensis TaxID=1720316 RepID=A0A845QSJ4_9CLOT|nr:hypothetical protein [Senegalia massiliensis]NBI05777.1 hypothetical protein [Senegalia massiliensis]
MKQIKKQYYKRAEKALYNYTQFKINILNMKEQLECLKNEDGVNCINYEGEKTSETNKITRQLEEQAIRNIKKEKQLKYKIKTTQHEVNKIDRALEGLTDIEKKVIELRYIKGYQWFNIAYEAQYNERWCKEIRTQALQKISISLFGYTALLEHE